MAAQDVIADQLDTLAANVRDQVAGVWQAVEAGTISADTGRDLVSVLVDLGTAQAEQLAVVTYARGRALSLSELPSLPTPKSPRDWALNRERLEAALDKVIDGDPEQIAMRLKRLANSEPAYAYKRKTGDLMNRDPRSLGWERGMNSDACQLCTWWWREGQLWAPNHVMPTHTGCMCRQIPMWTRNPDDIEYVERRTREIGNWQANIVKRDARLADIKAKAKATRAAADRGKK